ncbi:MAG: hypothetical protein E3J81_03180 [Dehalococcoidia bacterium]|nr:MAG: hypothetical protein E3J81_03180 [Dehalococcoidia bacterium]
MRTLSSTLTAAQKSSSARPHPKVEVFEKIGGITRLSWTRLYEGSESDSFHACCMPGDGSLIRLRVDPSTNELYRQRVTSPDESSDYSQWTDWGVTAYAVALCSYAANVHAWRIGTDGILYLSVSTDNGASFGSWLNMGGIDGTADFRLAACFKNANEAIVLYWDGTNINRRRYDATAAATWVSPTGHSDPGGEWYNEVQTYDDDTGTFGYDANVRKDTWSSFIEFTHAALLCSKVRYYASNIGAGAQIDIDAYYGDAWHDVYEGDAATSAYTEHAVTPSQMVTRARVRLKPVDTLRHVRIHDFDFEQDNTWEVAAAWTNSMNSISGVAVTYMGDWNIVVTGTQATTMRPIVCTCVLGDGYSAAVGNWSSLKELTIAETDSDIAFKFPALDMPDVFRAFFVEAYSGNEPYNRPYWTHSLATADFIDNLWREPVPFNLSSDYGLAMCHKSPSIWLTRPDGVWRASVSAGSVEITDSVLQIEALTNETSGRITIVLRNDDGRFADIGQSGDTYEAIRLGSEIKFSPGYHTTAGSSPEHSTGLAHWITGWEYSSSGGRAEFILHAVDGWGLLEEWKARRQFLWASGDKNIFQLLNFIFARAGLEFSSFSSSSAITAQYPTFTIYPRESGKTTVLRLLAMVEDVLFFRGHYGYLKHPQTSDSTDYTYGTDHAIHEGIYRQYVKQVNRAQAFGDSVFTEDWDWDEVELVWDKLAQAYDTNLDTTTKAHQRGDAMLREAAIRAISGHIIVPLNCGQELYDVVEITDSRAGLSSAKRRILGLNHHYVPAKGIYSLTAILGTV